MYYDDDNRFENPDRLESYHGLEPFRNYEPEAPKKKARKGWSGLKLAALALACALLGGAAGGGAVWAAAGKHGPVVKETTIQMAAQPYAVETAPGASPAAATTAGNTVAGSKRILTDAELYATQVQSVVSINVNGYSTNSFGQNVPSASSGSGFLLTRDGYIVTNYHVIKGAQTVKVTLYNNEEYTATVVGGDEDYDIALIKIDGAEFQAVTVGDSSLLKVGDHVTTIGNPLGELTFSMSGGMASSVNRAINVEGTPFNMIQVTCAINPGNSGGPLFNEYGEVVGIVSAKYSSYASTSVEGLGFAIPINDVLSLIEDVMTNGYVTNKPYLGISCQTMNATWAAQYRFDVTSGVFIFSVEEGSAAEKAGLQRDDVITKVDDVEVKSTEDFNAAKKKYSAGDSATLTVYRDGKTITVDIVWDAVPEEQKSAAQEDSRQNSQNQAPSNGNGQYGYGYPFGGSLFDYFFGNGYGYPFGN